MTSARLTISLPEVQLELVRQAVREGRAASLSAYVAWALAQQSRADALAAVVRDLVAQHGEPNERDTAWARRVLAARKRR